MESSFGTVGERSVLPLNHGFTLCVLFDTTSVRCPAMRDLTWLVMMSSASPFGPPPRVRVSYVTPLEMTATAAQAAARRTQ